MITDLIYINLIINFIFFSGAIDEMKKLLSKLLTKNKVSTADYSLKPFDCNLCCVWWCSILYCCFVDISFYSVLLCSANAFLSPIVLDCYVIIHQWWQWLKEKIMY